MARLRHPTVAILPLVWLTACAADPAPIDTGVPEAEWPEDCAGLDVSEAQACGEEVFWTALQTARSTPERIAAYELIGALIAEHEGDPPADPEQVARLYFQHGQLAMALGIENEETRYIMEVIPDIERAIELDPANTIMPTWKDTMEIAFAHIMSDDVALEASLASAWENVALNPLGNVLSVSGTTIGLPLETGAPHKTIALMDEWVCEGVDFCDQNTPTAPFARPGLEYHFGEAYARVGELDTAQAYMEASLQAPGADDWPYRDIAADAAEDIEAFAQPFADLGEDGSAFNMVYANQTYGCAFCHAPAGTVDR